MKPLKAQPYVERKLAFPAFAQPKLNGVRAVYQSGQFYSGDEKLWSSQKLKHLTTELETILGDATIITDGELYVHGWSLQRINGAVSINSREPRHDTHLVEYHVFDCVKLDTTFSDRQALLKSLFNGINLERIRLVRTDMVYNQASADSYFTLRALEGYEGCMYRLGDCPYTLVGRGCNNQDNRVPHMLKRKAWKDDDFRVVGVEEGKHTVLGGKYVGSLGAFILETETGARFTAAPAFTDTERQYYFDHRPINQKAIVKYLNLSDTGIPLHPIVLAIREA